MKKGFLKRLLKGIGNGIIDSVPVLATIKDNIQNPHLSTPDNPTAGSGQIDWTRLIITVGSVSLIALAAFGKISIDQVKELLDLLNR